MRNPLCLPNRAAADTVVTARFCRGGDTRLVTDASARLKAAPCLGLCLNTILAPSTPRLVLAKRDSCVCAARCAVAVVEAVPPSRLSRPNARSSGDGDGDVQ